MKILPHSKARGQQRAISEEQMETVFTHGDHFEMRDCILIVINQTTANKYSDTPETLADAEDIVLVTMPTGEVLTCYRKRNAWNKLHREKQLRSRCPQRFIKYQEAA